VLMYAAVGVLPLVRKLKGRGFCAQIWYAMVLQLVGG